MELGKISVHVPVFKGKTDIQLTLDHDFNVPETKPDIDRLIQEKGDIRVTEVKPMKDSLLVRGELVFGVLYMGEGPSGPLYAAEDALPFEERVNMDGLEETDTVRVLWDMEDLRAGVINSRKINIRSIVVLHAQAIRVEAIEAAAPAPSPDGCWSREETFHISRLAVCKKDQIRVRDEAPIPSNRPNMMELIWHQENLENMEIRLTDAGVSVRGDLEIFLLYADEALENPVNDVELTIPIDAVIHLPEASQEMLPNIRLHMDHMNLEIRSDKDGEARIVGIEAVLAADMMIYAEEEVRLLQDIYSPKVMLIPQLRPVTFENIILKNQSKVSVREKVKQKEGGGKMLQICHAKGTVKLDQAVMTDRGIEAEGVVYLRLLYISDDDRRPVNAAKAALPFSCTIETGEGNKNGPFEVYPSIEQMSVSMSSGDELDVKAVLSLDTFVYTSVSARIITDVKEEALDLEKIGKMPGMVGYITKEGDTLWKLAKCFFASPEDIREINGLESDELTPGTPLLIMKNMDILS